MDVTAVSFDITDKYDGFEVVYDGRLRVPPGAQFSVNGWLVSSIYYTEGSLYQAPVVWFHLRTVQECANMSRSGDIITCWDRFDAVLKTVKWKLTGRVHPHYEHYHEAVWPD